MKDWQFFLAILALLILMLPIHEGFQPKAAVIPNGVYYIKCGNKFCSMEGKIIVCKKDKPELKDLFFIEKVNAHWMTSGGYSIMPVEKVGIEQCADEGYRVVCNRGYVNTWETFKIMDIGGGFYTINGGNYTNWDRQFCSGAGGNFLCKNTSVGTMEKFQLITPVQSQQTCPQCPAPTTCPPPVKCPPPPKCPQCPPLSCDGEINTLSKMNGDLQSQINRTQTQLSGLEGRVGGLQSNYTDLNGQYGKMQNDVAGVESSYTGVQTIVSQLNGEKIPYIQKSLDDMKINQNGIKDQLRVIQDVTIPSVNSEISTLYGKNDKLSELQKYYTAHGSVQDVSTYK
jgi:hypothetical protein